MTQQVTESQALSTASSLSTSSIGRHSELLAMAALIANGWSVSEPTVPEAHDLEARKGALSIRIQVKTIKQRTRDGIDYYVIRGLKNSGQAYTLADCDAFIGVIGDSVYMTTNREISEYWIRADEVDDRWTKLAIQINDKGAI